MHLFPRKSPGAGAVELLAAVLAVFGSVPVRPPVVVVVGLAAKTVLAGSNNSSRAGGLSEAAQSLFDFSMQVQDPRWDDDYKAILFQETAGEFSTRFTAWYTAGLLHRNEGDDVENAKAALENILAAQMSSQYDSAWYGTFKVTLDTPVPTDDSSYWPPEIYNTYDPNWREFIGTQLIQVVELYSDLVGDELVGRIEDALEVAAVGAMRRNGSYPDGDNLILGYTNPQLMRCLTVGWVGARRANQTLVDWADEKGAALWALFEAGSGGGTLGEYNAPTYYGMDVWALVANAAYGPAGATMTRRAGAMLTALWRDVADHYNPYLRNLAGPYDRAYTRDMTMHSSVLSLWWWGLWGRGYGGQAPLGDPDLLYDAAQGAALALVMDTAARYVADETAAALQQRGKWAGTRFLNKTIRGDLSSDSGQAWRVATSWLSAEVMIGAESTGDTTSRGAQFVPAIVHWASDPGRKKGPYVGFLSLYPSAATVEAVAGGGDGGTLMVAYPNTTQAGADIFTFAVSGLPPRWTLGGHVVRGLEELPCLRVNVSAPGLARLPVTASSSMLEDHYYYNVSYVVPAGFEGVPRVRLAVQYTC